MTRIFVAVEILFIIQFIMFGLATKLEYTNQIPPLSVCIMVFGGIALSIMYSVSINLIGEKVNNE